ncbi:MAG TPA: tail fiber domain-containing protein [Rhizomicrobium sp.]|jgi:hypothetical protein
MTTTNLGMTVPTVGADTDNWGNDLNTDLGLIDAFAGKLMPGAEVTLASAATTDIGNAASTAVAISGTTAITSFGTVANCIRFVRFTGALTLTHNATSLILLGGASRATVAGAVGVYRSDSSGNWRELAYHDQDLSRAASAVLGALAINGALATGKQFSVNGDSQFGGSINIANNITGAASVIAGSMTTTVGSYTNTGFGNTSTFDWGGIATSYGGGFTVQCVSGGAILNEGATSWAANSDKRLKMAFKPIVNALQKIAQLNPVTFKYKTDKKCSRRRVGLIAQDARKAQREAVYKGKDGFLQLALCEMVPLAFAGIQALVAENRSLKKRLVKIERLLANKGY